MVVAKVTSKGQVTIPLPVRKALGLDTGSRVEFVLKDGTAVIEPVRGTLAELEGMFAGAAQDKSVSVEDMNEAIAAAAGGRNRPR